jgi:hypothetical protein
MKKLSLILDEIHVSGFEVGAAESLDRGTVQGAEAITRYTFCNDETCWATCAVTCDPGLC